MLLTVNSVYLRFEEPIQGAELTLNFKFGDQIQESSRIPVNIGRGEIGKLTKIETYNCNFGSQVMVKEKSAKVDKSRLNKATGRGAKFVTQYQCKPFQMYIKLYTPSQRMGKKIHERQFPFESLVNTGL